MNKIESLKNLKEVINEICVGLETRLFVDGDDFEDERIIMDYSSGETENKKTR